MARALLKIESYKGSKNISTLENSPLYKRIIAYGNYVNKGMKILEGIDSK